MEEQGEQIMRRTNRLLVIAVLALAGGPTLAADAQVPKGQEVYKTLRCSMCHKVNGSGGKKGPDLSDVGSKRDAVWLKRYMTNPKAENPKNTMPPVKASAEDLDALIAYLNSLKTGK